MTTTMAQLYFLLRNGIERIWKDVSVLQVLLIITVLLLVKFLNSRKRNLPPGPTGLPFLGYLPFLGDKPYKTLASLSEKYGPIISVRLGSKLVVILNEFEVLTETLCHPAALDRSPGIFDHIPRSGFISRNGAEWIEQRRFTLKSTRDLGLGRSGWKKLVQDEVDIFVKNLRSSGGIPKDISRDLLGSLANCILTILIGRKPKHEDHEFQLMAEFAECTLTYTGPSYAVSLMPKLREAFEYFGLSGYDKVAETVSHFGTLIKNEINIHRSQEDLQGLTDFISLYQNKLEKALQNKKTHFYSEDILEGNVKIYFLGGTDTLFSSLGWLFRLMAAHPDIQKNVQKELDHVIGREGEITYGTRFDVPYSMAVIMEAQRYSSIVPLNTTRRANRDFQIRGYTIPAGTDIIGNLWAIHNDPNHWHDPQKFNPEHFLSRGKIIKSCSSYLPFSIGRRNCPGETAAWMSILLYFTATLQAFDIRTEDGINPKFVVEEGLVSHLKPQKLRFIERVHDK